MVTQAIEYAYKPMNFIRGSRVMRELYSYLELIALLTTPVNLIGESGTGKEVLARHIHYSGDRKNNPFVPVNCAEERGELSRTEFFGHEKGAFTSAHEMKRGYLEEADGGTLFLDEVTEMPIKIQKTLLRALEYGFSRVGGTKVVIPDIRIITASTDNLESALSDGRFYKPFYHRIEGEPIYLPPLRERKEDIRFLANHFLEKYGKKYEVHFIISDSAYGYLKSLQWQGNVRELARVVQRTVELKAARRPKTNKVILTKSDFQRTIQHPYSNTISSNLEWSSIDNTKHQQPL